MEASATQNRHGWCEPIDFYLRYLAICALVTTGPYFLTADEAREEITSDRTTDHETAGYVLDFDGVEPTWELVRRVVDARVVSRKRSDAGPHSGLRSEYWEVQAARGGNKLLMTQDLPPCMAIEELRIGLWVRGNRPGYQLMARLRLPRTLSRDTAEPVSLFLLGDTYTDTGRWQQLRLTQFASQLANKTRVLRADLGREVDSAEAYVDMAVLNIYGGPGINQIWIDDLTLDGFVDATTIGLPSGQFSPAAIQESSSAQRNPYKFPVIRTATDVTANSPGAVRPVSFRLVPPPERNNSVEVRLVGGQIEIEHELFLPRVVQHQGESFEFLRQLGFNTIWLSSPPNDRQMDAAASSRLWLISPPPNHSVTNQYHRVLAWVIGTDVEPEEFAAVLAKHNAIRARDPLRRPTLITTQHHEVNWASACDVVGIPTIEPRLHTNPRGSGDPATVNWSLVDVSQDPTAWIPARNAMHAGLLAGHCGFLLPSQVNLERAEALRQRGIASLLNLELAVLYPWATTSLKTLHPRDMLSPETTIPIVTNEQATLGLPSVRSSSVDTSLRIPLPDATYVFSIDPGGLGWVAHQQTAGGIDVQIEADTTPRLLLTDSPTAVEHMTRKLRDVHGRWRELLANEARFAWLHLERSLQSSELDRAATEPMHRELYKLRDQLTSESQSESESRLTGQRIESVLVGLDRLQRRLRDLERSSQSGHHDKKHHAYESASP